MKKLIIVLMVLVSHQANAQTFAEWFRQKKTQKKYLLLQIAALQVYKGYVRKGNSINQNGLNTIGNNTGDEYTEHRNYQNSLKRVNANVRQNPKVASIKAMQVDILKESRTSYSQLQITNAFLQEEMQYIDRVYKRLSADCEQIIQELNSVTTNGELKMTDDERLAVIEKLYHHMQDNFTFCNHFSSTAKKLAVSRLKEQREVENSHDLYDIKK